MLMFDYVPTDECRVCEGTGFHPDDIAKTYFNMTPLGPVLIMPAHMDDCPICLGRGWNYLLAMQ